MKQRMLGCLLTVGLLVFAAVGHTADSPKTAAFMHLKLTHAQKILEGLAMEDYRAIEKNSQELSTLSRDEMWQLFQTPEYLQYSLDFRRSADAIAAAAKKRNIDGAALAYVGMTMQCVNCHKHVRDVAMAQGRDMTSPMSGGD